MFTVAPAVFQRLERSLVVKLSRRGVAVAVIAGVGSLSIAAAADARGTVDQSNPDHPYFFPAFGQTGQFFTAGRTGRLDAVSLRLFNYRQSIETFRASLSVRAVDSDTGAISDEALTTGEATGSLLPYTQGDALADLATPVDVEEGKRYFLELTSVSNPDLYPVYGENTYPGGTAYRSLPLAKYDLTFATYVSDPLPSQPLASGSGATASGSALSFNVQGPLSAPTGTFSLRQSFRTLSGTVTCMSFRNDGKDKYFGKRAVIGIKTDETKPRYIEYYVQDVPKGTADRIVQTGTAKGHLRTAPPAGCYHTAPASIERKNALQDGSITLTRSAKQPVE